MPGNFDWRCSGWADLHFPRVYHKANYVLDGELMKLGRDVSIRLHPGELKVLVPA